jgi:hypothetical protein
MMFLGCNVVVLAAIVTFKGAVSAGIGVPGSYLHHLARLALGSTATSFGSYGVGLPEATRWAVATVDGVTLAAGIALASVVGVYLGGLGRRDASIDWSVRTWLKFVAAGLLVFALGYGIFLTNARILFSSSGISNRVAIAAAAGLAMIWVGLAGAVSAAVPRRWRAVVLALPVAALCLSSFLIVHGLAASWAEAWQRQQALLADIRTRLPTLEPHTTIILDGDVPTSDLPSYSTPTGTCRARSRPSMTIRPSGPTSSARTSAWATTDYPRACTPIILLATPTAPAYWSSMPVTGRFGR